MATAGGGSVMDKKLNSKPNEQKQDPASSSQQPNSNTPSGNALKKTPVMNMQDNNYEYRSSSSDDDSDSDSDDDIGPPPTIQIERSAELGALGMDSVHQELLKDAADFVNAKLGQVLKGPILAEVRLERTSNSSGYCERPMCAEAEFPVEYALPCTDADGQLLMTDDTVPGEPTDQVLADNNASYSMVVLLAVHGPDAPDYNCRYFEEMNKNRPLCRWFGPAVMGVVCQWGDFKRPTHARLTFCKKPDEFADNQGELKMVMLHEILHFVIDKMDMDGTAAKLIERPWQDDSGNRSTATFAIVASPNVLTVARTYFQCNHLDGAEVPIRIYPNGTLLPKWGHWSFRLFPDDVLAPHTSYDEKLSPLTLAAIADRGWYAVDTEKAEPLPQWHFTMNGCELATNSCHDLIREARYRSDSLVDIWPICDRENPISTRCTADGHRRLLCHQIEGYSCHTLHSAACIGHHPLCENATQQSHLFSRIDFQHGQDSMCVTVTSFPGIAPAEFLKEYYLPPCILRRCSPNDETIVLTFNATIPCEFACTRDMADKLVEYIPNENCKSALDQVNDAEKIQLICPDYNIICEGGNGSWPKNGSKNLRAGLTVLLVCAFLLWQLN